MTKRRDLDAAALSKTDDWVGNNAAFTCPRCSKVFIVSGLVHRDGRVCPDCESATGFVEGGAASDGTAWIEWEEPASTET